jgi:ATP-dependent DNA ligase
MVPSAAAWFHEVKQDGYRMMVVKDGDDVRLMTKGGHNWAKRYPWIVETARRIRSKQFVLDGEAVLLGVDGVGDFAGLHSRKHDDEVQLYTFDILAADGDDYRKLPLSMRKLNLERILRRRADGIFVATFETGAIGPDLFRAACNLGLEGLVSKHGERWYGAGPCAHWIKTKNPKHPAYRRVQDQF